MGTLWSVRDSAAAIFCETFYNALIHEQKTFGESALAARTAVAAKGDPSWLAYVVYAHPNERLALRVPNRRGHATDRIAGATRRALRTVGSSARVYVRGVQPSGVLNPHLNPPPLAVRIDKVLPTRA